MSEENISDSSLSFLRSKEDLELELEKALAEAKAVEMQLRVLELDRILALRRRAREHRRLMDEKEQLVTTVEVGVETAFRIRQQLLSAKQKDHSTSNLIANVGQRRRRWDS